jgi:Zn-dependent protease with chaperone function
MDFFRAQDDARRKTWRLVVLFVLAVIALVIVTNLLVGVTVAWYGTHTMVTSLDPLVRTMPTAYWPVVTTAVVGVIGAASGYKYLALRSGGRAVAALVGGRKLDPSTGEPAERRLLNVVEEMSIASGIPVPPTYLVPDPAINAFAAGHGPDDAVIAVTDGTLRYLTRDELQGVIGHELSHVLNGDSRLNLRLIAVLHGILFIGLLGRGLARSVRYGRRREAPALGLLGFGLIAIGYAGTFCGNLIKAAVSRQREFLADAAAVQFTRNPDGIAGALKKIGAATEGSVLRAPRAAEISHLFFAEGLRRLGGWFATHPPLAERIRAIDPRWDGTYPTLDGVSNGVVSKGVRPPLRHEFDPSSASALATQDALEIAPALSGKDVTAARVAIDDLGAVGAATRDAFHARALCYALLGAGDTSLLADARLDEIVGRLRPQIKGLPLTRRLHLVSLSMPALKQMSEPQYQEFVRQVIALIKADRRIDLFEWVLHRLMLKELRPQFESVVTPPVRYSSLDEVPAAVSALTGALRSSSPDLDALNDALRELRMLAPLAKPKLLKTCLEAVSGGTSLSDDQRALLIGIAAALDCPLPPTVTEQSFSADG